MIAWQFTPYVLPTVVSAVVSAWLAFTAWRRRPLPGATMFSLLMLAVAEWSLGYGLELASPDLPTKLFWDNVTWLGAVSAPAAWLAFTLQYTGREQWLTRRKVAILAIEPLITLLLVWTNDVHGLISSHISLDTGSSFSALVFTYGAAFWANIAYSYLLLLLGTLLICPLIYSSLRSASLYRGQASALLIAVLAPWVSNVLTTFGWNPFSPLDLTPFAFTITGLAIASSLFRFRLLDIIPVAREAIIESMNDAVIVLDEQNRIVDLNSAAQGVVDHTAAKAIGQPITRVFSGWAQLVEGYHDVTEAQGEIVLGAGEAQRYFDVHISYLYPRKGDSHLTGHLVILHDITERKRAEKALRESEESFRKIFIAYEQQQQLNQLKDEFLQNVSHELRTPLAAIQGYIALLQEYDGQLDSAMRTTFLNNANRGCEELLSLVNNVLDTVQLGKNGERGQSPQLEELAVAQVVQDVLTQIDPRKQADYSISLDIADNLMVSADPQHLRRVLRNLLSNAFNYSPGHSSVRISATLSDIVGQKKDASSHVCICVKDSGPGIPPAEIPLLFGKFVRLKRDLSGSVRGTGLGLYISKELVEAMDGSIWVENTGISGQGGCFCFTLPHALHSTINSIMDEIPNLQKIGN